MSDDRSQDGRTYAQVMNSAVFARQLRQTIGAVELAGIFRRGSELVHTPRIGEDGYVEPDDPGIDLGPAQVRTFTAAQLKALAGIKFFCFVEIIDKMSGQTMKLEKLPPKDAVIDAYEAARMGEDAPNLRTLRGVTHTPTMRPDGSILDRPGYDDATGILFLPDAGLDMPPVPDNPTAEELSAARDELLSLVDQVPWVSEDNQATWLGLAMTPALRAILPPPYPLGLFTAPNPGSGKTRLAAIIRMLHGGVVRGDLPADKEELRKQITATLVDTTAPVVTWDNLTGVVRSQVLERLLTEDTWSDRYLGHSRDVTTPNDRLWIATGNNATIGGDLGRRVLVVEIDHKRPDPHLRTDFRITDLAQHLDKHRGELLAAMFTIARAWHVAGQPQDRDRGDSYATWAGSLRAMLAMAGVPGRFGGETSTIASKVDPETEEWAAFAASLFEWRKSGPFTAKALVQALSDDKVDPSILPGDLAHKWERVANTSSGYGTTHRDKSGFTRTLGNWLRNRNGRYAHGWKIEQTSGDAVHGHAYRVIKPKEAWQR
jgi:hypothetical protein